MASTTRRSPQHWVSRRAQLALRWRGPAAGWSRPTARKHEGRMPHLDEGTLHALLDGELELAEVKEIQTHLGACAACGSRLHDVKQFLSEADRLVADLQTPPGAPRARQEPAPPPAQHPPSGMPFREPIWDAAPELLLPGDPEDVARRRRWTRRLRWAAMI